MAPQAPRIIFSFRSTHSPSAAHLSCNGGRVAQLLRGGSWINNPHNARAAFRNSNHPDNVNTNVGVRPGCFSPPAPFTVRAVGRDSSGSARRVQTRSGDRRSPLARPAPSQRPHDPHNPGPLPHGPRPGLPGGLLLRSHSTGSNTSKMHINSGSGCNASLTRTGSPQVSRGESSCARGGSIDGRAAITAARNPSP